MASPRRTTCCLRKLKLPSLAEFRYEAEILDADDSGWWLSLPRGARWSAPHDHGQLTFEAVVLLNQREPWVAWWVDHPGGPRLQIDLARPAVHDDLGWAFVDLELDIFVAAGTSRPILLDQDDLLGQVNQGSISLHEAQTVRRVADNIMASLDAGRLPWVERGWTLLTHP